MHALKNFLTHHWFAKLFSMVLATMLWITISSEANSEIGIVVPLEYRNVPAQLEITGDTTNTVEVRLRGPAALIKEVSLKNISAIVDLSKLPEGEKIVQLTQHNMRVPFGIEVVRVNPAQIRLNLEVTMSKKIPVTVRLEGEAAHGVEVVGTNVEPATVEVQGPESKVRSLQAVPTAIVKIDGKKESFSQSVDLDLPDPMVRLQYLSPVQVHVTIRERGSR
jgi:YbbR domain-containing protein